MSLYQNLNQSLEPVLGERTSMILEEGVRRLGISPDQLDASQAEVILKRLVYRELQSKMSPSAARSRIEELLRDLGSNAQTVSKAAEEQIEVQTKNILQDLEVGLKRFSMYLDWPEVGRLRSLVGVIRQDPEASTVRSLMREGQEVLSQLEDKLQAALLRQTRDISELQAALERVQNVGGPKVRRLDNYIKAIQEAHGQETLAQAEVERARSLAAEMRKLVESSVVQSPPTTEAAITIEDEPIEAKDDNATWDDSELVVDLDFESLSAEQQSRIREIDVTEDIRRLESLLDRYNMLTAHPTVASEVTALQAELASGNPVGERIGALEEAFKGLYSQQLQQGQGRYQALVGRWKKLELVKDRAGPAGAKLQVAGETLQAGGLPQDLGELEQALNSLEAEEQTQRETNERNARLKAQLASVRADAESSLSNFQDNFDVEMFLATVADLPPTEDAIGRAQMGLSELLAQLTREREEQSLRRIGLKAAVQAIPSLEGIEVAKSALLGQVETAPIDELEQAIASLLAQSKQMVGLKLDGLEVRISELEGFFKESLPELRAQLQTIRQNLAQGRFADTSSLERALLEVVNARRSNTTEELTRLEMTARSLKGLGGEELEQKVLEARAELQRGGFPNLEEIRQQLSRIRRSQEALRAELGGRISALIESYDRHKSVGGETALRLKPMCDFLTSASQRLDRLGASGLIEVRRALEDAERLESQLAAEFQAAQSVMDQLKGANLDSLLDVFDTPAMTAPLVDHRITPTVNANLPEELTQALASFQFRGVEAVALVENGQLLWGNLPLDSKTAQSVFTDLGKLADEMSNGSPQLSLISLTQAVIVLLPLAGKGLVILAEKNLQSRILMQIEKQRDILEKA